MEPRSSHEALSNDASCPQSLGLAANEQTLQMVTALSCLNIYTFGLFFSLSNQYFFTFVPISVPKIFEIYTARGTVHLNKKNCQNQVTHLEVLAHVTKLGGHYSLRQDYQNIREKSFEPLPAVIFLGTKIQAIVVESLDHFYRYSGCSRVIVFFPAKFT